MGKRSSGGGKDMAAPLAELLRLQTEQLAAHAKQPVDCSSKFAFPIIRRAATQLVSSDIVSDIVSVQPMTAPVGGVAFYGAFYGKAPLKTPLLELAERVWADEDPIDGSDIEDKSCE